MDYFASTQKNPFDMEDIGGEVRASSGSFSSGEESFGSDSSGKGGSDGDINSRGGFLHHDGSFGKTGRSFSEDNSSTQASTTEDKGSDSVSSDEGAPGSVGESNRGDVLRQLRSSSSSKDDSSTDDDSSTEDVSSTDKNESTTNVEMWSHTKLVEEVKRLRAVIAATKTNHQGFVLARNGHPSLPDSPFSGGSYSFLAEGGFGQVFRAKGKIDKQPVAIKEISVKSIDSHKFNRKLAEAIQEAEIHGSISPHKNIVEYRTILMYTTPSTNKNESTPSSLETLREGQALLHAEQRFEMPVGFGTPVRVHDASEGGSPASTATADAEHQAKVMIVMELCTEGSLKEYIDKHGETTGNHLRTTLSLFSGAVAGVACLHDHGFLHRDMKPANIFLQKEKHGNIVAKIGDFGLSCKLEDESTMGTTGDGGMGTPFYSSPEQVDGRKHGVSSDVFSLGVVLFEVVYNPSSSSDLSLAWDDFKNSDEPPFTWTNKLGFFVGHEALFSLIKNMVKEDPLERASLVEVQAKIESLPNPVLG